MQGWTATARHGVTRKRNTKRLWHTDYGIFQVIRNLFQFIGIAFQVKDEASDFMNTIKVIYIDMLDNVFSFEFSLEEHSLQNLKTLFSRNGV